MMIIPRTDTVTEILASASIISLPIFSRYFKFTIKEEILLAGHIFFRLVFNSDDKISLTDSTTHSFYPQANKLSAWHIKSSIIKNYLVVARSKQ